LYPALFSKIEKSSAHLLAPPPNESDLLKIQIFIESLGCEKIKGVLNWRTISSEIEFTEEKMRYQQFFL